MVLTSSMHYVVCTRRWAGRWEWEADGDDLDPVRRHRNTTPCPPTLHPHRSWTSCTHTSHGANCHPSNQPTAQACIGQPWTGTVLSTVPTYPHCLPSVPCPPSQRFVQTGLHLRCIWDAAAMDASQMSAQSPGDAPHTPPTRQPGSRTGGGRGRRLDAVSPT